jgi:GT2 family glycosyltransferase
VAPVRSTVVVVTWRGSDHLAACLQAVHAQTRPHGLVVVDNDADEATRAVLEAHRGTARVHRTDVNLGYAGALAAVRVDTELVCWLNDDAVLAPTWLAAAEDALWAGAAEDALSAGAAAVGAVLVDGAGALVSCGVTLDGRGRGRDRTSWSEALAAPCGAAVLLRTAELAAVGGVDGRLFCYSEDLDVGWRLRLAGHRVAVLDDPVVTHPGGGSGAHGSWQFHRWNERNRLLVLLRNAPLAMAVRELARFGALTAVLPLRGPVSGANFSVRLRVGVLGEVLVRAPGVLRRRGRVDRATRARIAHELGVG